MDDTTVLRLRLADLHRQEARVDTKAGQLLTALSVLVAVSVPTAGAILPVIGRHPAAIVATVSVGVAALVVAVAS